MRAVAGQPPAGACVARELPLNHSLTGNLRPYIPLGQVAAILGVSALATIALAIPTRRALRKPPITALATAE
jgi:hypothetical protein